MPEASLVISARTLYRKLSGRRDAALNEIPMSLVRLLTGRRLRIKVRGQPFIVDTHDVSVSASILLQRNFEIRETLVASKLLRAGDLAVDVGANIGWYATLFGEAVGPAGQVLAIEPEPANAAILKENLRIRGISDVVAVAEVALGDAPGTAMLALSNDQKGDHRVVRDTSATTRATIDVPIVRLDDLAANWPRVDFLKMDIQGSEVRALHGMRSLLDRSAHAVLLVEFWPYGMRACDSDPLDLLESLASLGFGIWRVNREGPVLDRIDRSHFLRFVEGIGYDELVAAPNILCTRSEARLAPLLG